MSCGRERTEAEFAELLAGAGFRLAGDAHRRERQRRRGRPTVADRVTGASTIGRLPAPRPDSTSGRVAHTANRA
jgi:hypothetical protein